MCFSCATAAMIPSHERYAYIRVPAYARGWPGRAYRSWEGIRSGWQPGVSTTSDSVRGLIPGDSKKTQLASAMRRGGEQSSEVIHAFADVFFLHHGGDDSFA